MALSRAVGIGSLYMVNVIVKMDFDRDASGFARFQLQ